MELAATEILGVANTTGILVLIATMRVEIKHLWAELNRLRDERK